MSSPISSKPLSGSDESGASFAKEMLEGDITAGINFDRLQKHPTQGYIMFEYLLCDEKQTVDPFTSHPNRYWDKNSRKFIALWEASQKLNAKLYLVNYAKKGTKNEDKILLIEVLKINDKGIIEETLTKMTRNEFKAFFRKLNKECL